MKEITHAYSFVAISAVDESLLAAFSGAYRD